MSESSSQREKRLLDMAGGDLKLAVELARIFLSHYDEMHRSLADAVERRDPLDVRRMVHSIEGSLGAMGSLESIEKLSAIGQAGRDERRDLFEELFLLYEDAINRSNDEIRLFIDAQK